MKQQKIVQAYKVIEKIQQKEYPLDITYAFYKLKKALSDQWNFQIEQEKQIFEKYHPTQDENNMFSFETKEDKEGFLKDINDLADLEVDWNMDRIHVNIGDRMDISVADLEALDEFMEIE